MRRLAASLIGVFALLLAGCAGVPGAVTPRPEATPVEAFGCGVPDPGTPAGAVPAGFAPVAAYLCDPYATQDDAQGTWSGSRLTRYEGDLAPLLAALAEPDEPASGGACPAIGFAGPLLWLGDAGGRFVHAAYPATGCGMPRTDAVFAALDALTDVDEHFEPAQLVDSAAARRDGCPTTASPLVRLGHSAGAVPDLPDGGQITLCRYEADLPASDAPDAAVSSPVFAGSTALDATAVAALRDAAGALAAPAACSNAASRYVVLVPRAAADGATVIVELDGCRRLIDRAHRAYVAPAALLALLGG
jgi:hypothetical protein